MTGNKESVVDNRFDKEYSVVLDYLNNIGFRAIKYNTEAEFILELNYDTLLKLDSQTCNVYAYELCKYSLFIQKEENYLKGRLIWAEHNLNIMYGKYGRTYGDKFTPYEERKNMVLTTDEFAIALNSMILDVKLRLSNLHMITNKITSLHKILEGLSYGKKASEKNY